MKNKIIVLNLLHYVTDKLMDVKDKEFIEVLKDIQKQGNVHVLLVHIVENHCWGLHNPQELITLANLRKILFNLGIKYHFLFDALYENQHKISNRNDIIFVNYGILLTYDYIFLNDNAFSSKWNKCQHNKGLFLCGKGAKPNRAYLLRKFYENNLLSNLIWSFDNSQQELKTIRESTEFSDYTNEQWDEFLLTCINILDLQPDHIHEKNFFQYSGYPVNIDLYKNTSYSIITETLFVDDLFRIGEKTWRVILNHHPFLMAAPYRTLVELRKMGFKTFDNYAEHVGYDLVPDPQERLNLIVENVKTFSDSLCNNKEKVEKDIKHNYYKLLEYCKLYAERITETLNCDETVISQIINHIRI